MSRFFSQGDLVRIISKKIPSSGGVQSRDRFPHGIGIVTNIKNYEASENRIYLIPIHDKKIEEFNQSEYIKWIKQVYSKRFGRLVPKTNPSADTWYFLAENLEHFYFKSSEYFDDNLFRID